MRTRALLVVFSLTLLGLHAPMADAESAVELRVNGRFFVAPATLSITVAVVPDAENRVLRVEADGEQMFRASDLALSGANGKRIHTLQFKAMPEGHYTLRALLASNDELIGVDTHEVVVAGKGAYGHGRF